jgi:hypothetical protein
VGLRRSSSNNSRFVAHRPLLENADGRPNVMISRVVLVQQPNGSGDEEEEEEEEEVTEAIVAAAEMLETFVVPVGTDEGLRGDSSLG